MESRRLPKLGGKVSINRRMNEVTVSTTIDLSNSSIVDNVYYANYPMKLLEVKLVYTENSSNDPGAKISVGKVGNVNYFVDNVDTEPNKEAGYEQILIPDVENVEAKTLMNVRCSGGKDGAGEVVVVLILEGINR